MVQQLLLVLLLGLLALDQDRDLNPGGDRDLGRDLGIAVDDQNHGIGIEEGDLQDQGSGEDVPDLEIEDVLEPDLKTEEDVQDPKTGKDDPDLDQRIAIGIQQKNPPKVRPKKLL